MSAETVDVNMASHRDCLSAVFFPRDKNIHLFYRATPGNIEEVYFKDRSWHRLDLNAETGAPLAGGRPFSLVFFSSQETWSIHVFYRSNNSHIIWMYYDNSNFWHSGDLTARYKTPAASGDPTAVVFNIGNRRQIHLYYRDSNNHIYELYYDDQPGTWTGNDLSKLTNATPVDSDPSSAVSGSNQIHVLYRNKDRKTCDIWWNGNWNYTDLSGVVEPVVADGDPAAVSFQGNQLDVFFRGLFLLDLWDIYYNDGWKISGLGRLLKAPPMQCDPVAVAFKMSGGSDQLHALYVANTDLLDIWWNGNWSYQDLNKLLPEAAKPKPIPVTPLSFHNPDNNKNELHIFYRATSADEFWDIYFVDQWSWQTFRAT